jgi:hypothetical protein
MPAKAGIQKKIYYYWMPAFAGMTAGNYRITIKNKR